MILRLVWQSLRFAPGRSALMLLGYALGVGVMVALLSIGDALVEQSRDRDLLGGGELAVLPAGIDLETLRTGGVSSLYFHLDLARFFHREVLAGPRLAGSVEAAAPWLDDELVYVRVGDTVVAASAAGAIPSAAEALGAGPEIREGTWADGPADRRWIDPSPRELLAEIDAFHRAPGEAAADSTWAEWHYFNLLRPDGGAWLYVTWLVGGDRAGGGGGGQLLGTLVRADGPDRVYVANARADRVRFEPGQVDVEVLGSTVELGADGSYRLRATVPGELTDDTLRLELRVEPEPRRYLPAVDVSPGGFPSGYVVPVLRGRASGRVCVGRRCEDWTGGRAYHDHNWGVWRDVTWEWGQFQAGRWSIVYGGVRQAADPVAGRPAREGEGFLFAVDSLGLAAVLPVRSLAYDWTGDTPLRMRLRAARGGDTLALEATVDHVRASRRDPAATSGDVFFQMRGAAAIEGILSGRTVAASGDGFFETWRKETEEAR